MSSTAEPMPDHDPDVAAVLPEGATLEQELAVVLNRHSQENASNTPDWILAEYLLGCLAVWNKATQQRETWWGQSYAIEPPSEA